jgi:hypothetical protein
MFENLDLSAIHEENARTLVQILLNQIEELSASLREARVLIQEQRDEINRLKGEQGKPDIKANVPQPAANHSSHRPDVLREKKSDTKRENGIKRARKPAL